MDLSSSPHPPEVLRAQRVGAMIRALPTLLCALAGLVLGMLLWMPAGALAAVLPTSIRCEDWSGRLWSGRCERLSWQGTELGSVVWDWHLRPLGQRQLAALLLWQRADSWLRADVSVGASRQLRIAAAQGTLTLATLRTLAGPRSGDFARDLRLDGRIELNLDSLVLRFADDGSPSPALPSLVRLEGQVTARGLRWLGTSVALGDVVARWSDDRAAIPPFATRLTPLDATLGVSGDIEFPQGRGYHLRVVAADAARRPIRLEFFGRW